LGNKSLDACKLNGHDQPACLPADNPALGPGRLWSLLDIMHKFRAPELTYLIKEIEEQRAYFSRLQFLKGGGDPPTEDAVNSTNFVLDTVAVTCPRSLVQ
jgi:hypothetical protein